MVTVLSVLKLLQNSAAMRIWELVLFRCFSRTCPLFNTKLSLQNGVGRSLYSLSFLAREGKVGCRAVCVCSSLPGDESASVGTVSPSAAGGALDL